MKNNNRTAFEPGQIWLDTDDCPIQAHGGGVLHDNGVYYWFGENKNTANVPGTSRVDVVGVSCYSSTDLLNWKNEGLVLSAVSSVPSHDLHPSQVLERPKVVYNKSTSKYVMWFHVDSPDYVKAATGVAVSDCVTGPYEYQGCMRPNELHSRDMTIFQDDDGRAYIVHSSDWNSVTIVSDLTADYLDFTGHYTRHFDSKNKNTGRESPAVFKNNGRYFCITSGTTGWHPNAAEYAVADNIHGPWTTVANPCVGVDADKTFHSQNTFVLPVADQPGKYIFMADRWVPDNLQDSRYVWLPLHVEGDVLVVEWRDSWRV